MYNWSRQFHLGLFVFIVAFFSSCTDDSSSSSSGGGDDSIVPIAKKTIKGVSQKGPFVKGTSVTVQELEGENLTQTGKSFKGKISNDKGEFSVSSVSLVSQYALLEANGFYRNEITGKKSSSQITLNALVDLSDREKVNINLLTHLEYERAIYLTEQGLDVDSAKKQAEYEVFNAFGIDGDFEQSVDLDILSSGEGNAALLAMSILMQGNLSESELSERLANFASDIEKDGSWDDDSTKARIADWAREQDLSGGFSLIRENIEKWKIGVVPDFEQYVSDYWYENYGIGKCDDEHEGEIAKNLNKLSDSYGSLERFICRDGAWIEASDYEKDTYGWKSGKEGETRKGDVTETMYIYDGENAAWHDTPNYDCSVSEGVVVVYPKGGETFKVGDIVKVVYGASPDLAGPQFIFRYRATDDDTGEILVDTSAGERDPDGKTCYEQEVILDASLVRPSTEAFIQVIPYVKTKSNGKSGKFTVTQ